MLQLRTRALAVAGLALAGAPAMAQTASPGGFSVNQQHPQADWEILEQLDVGAATLQSLSVPASPNDAFTVEVSLGDQREQLVLWPHSLRSSKYQLLVQGADGEISQHEPGPSTTYRGVVAGHPESVIAASMFGGQLDALVRIAPEREIWSVQPASEFDANASADQYVVASSLDDIPQDVTCGTGDFPVDQHPGNTPNLPQGGGNPVLLLCEIACDTDTQFYSQNGSSVSATEADIESILNGVEAIYESDVAITYDITTIIVRTSEPDPYSTTSANGMLSEVQSEWTQNQGSVPRDVAHLFTGKNISGSTIGIAWLSAICSNAFGYGLSQSKFSGSFNNRVGLTAHELGHNWGAGHCNGASGGCRIMCSSIGGCGPVTSFAPTSINAITNFSASAGCLDETGGDPPVPPAIIAFTPSSTVSAVTLGSAAHLSIIGTEFDTVTDVVVEGVSLGDLFPPGYTVASATQLDVVLPLQDTLGAIDVTVVGLAGNDTASLTVVPNSPPALELGTGGEPEVLLSIIPIEMTAGGQPGNVHFIWASFTLAPTIIPGTLCMDIGNGFLDLYLVDFPIIDPQGWTQRSLSGASLPPNTTIYLQSFEYDPISGALPVESSNVAEGLWLF